MYLETEVMNQNIETSYYKAYRNKLHHILKAAERQHYQNLLPVQKSNFKKILADQRNNNGK